MEWNDTLFDFFNTSHSPGPAIFRARSLSTDQHQTTTERNAAIQCLYSLSVLYSLALRGRTILEARQDLLSSTQDSSGPLPLRERTYTNSDQVQYAL